MSSGEEYAHSDDQNDIEIVEEVNENTEDQRAEADGQENENATKTIVKPKRVVRNPQPKLNEQTIKGPRGLTAIESYFERVKFKGRGYEEQDLNVLMKTYEYWCHRLFPKFPFDDCIARLEKLGTKRTTLTQLKKIRMGLNFDDDERLASDTEENDTAGFVDTYTDQFEQLLPNSLESQPAITEEQLERMRQNKERAERLRRERLRKIQEKAESTLEESNQLNRPERTFDASVAGSSYNQISIEERSQTNEIGDEGKTNEDEEDNIDNILDFMNTEEPTSRKKKKNVIESESEEEINDNNTDRIRILQNYKLTTDADEKQDKEQITRRDSENGINEGFSENILGEINMDVSNVTTDQNATPVGNNGNSYDFPESQPETRTIGDENNVTSKSIIQNDDHEDTKGNIENILHSKEKTTYKKKNVIESDSEDEVNNDTDTNRCQIETNGEQVKGKNNSKVPQNLPENYNDDRDQIETTIENNRNSHETLETEVNDAENNCDISNILKEIKSDDDIQNKITKPNISKNITVSKGNLDEMDTSDNYTPEEPHKQVLNEPMEESMI